MEEIKADTIRISKELIQYIHDVRGRYKKEYGIDVSIVEISKKIAERAVSDKLFN